MIRYDDYHRTVVGYHGTGLAAALRIVNRVEGFRPSDRDYDWLGRGIYFWEYAPRQALNFAKIRQLQYRKKRNKTEEEERRATEPLAVVACMIRLGSCLDLTEPQNIEYMGQAFDKYAQSMELANVPMPKNSRKYRRLDFAVFEYAYGLLKGSEAVQDVDTIRGVYVPTDGTKRVWKGSWISRDTHLQLCVRNRNCLLGTWLHYPKNLGVKDVCQALQSSTYDHEQGYSQGNISDAADADVETSRDHGRSGELDRRAGRSGEAEAEGDGGGRRG